MPDSPEERPPDPSLTRGFAEGFQAGDEASFARLYERVAPALYGWSRLRIPPQLRERLDPEDLMQEVWIRALSSFARFDSAKGSFRGWIFQVAKHTLLDAQRRAGVRSNALPAFGGTTATDAPRFSQLAEDATAVTQRVARDEAMQAFLERVGELGDEERDLLVHRGLEGMQLAEAAERLGLSTAAAEKRWQRLRLRLAESGWPEGLLAG